MRVQALLPEALNAIHAHVALVNDCGVIVAVNAAWDRFAADNAYAAAGSGLGTNYIEVCEASGATDPGAREIADALRDVLDGRRDAYEREYPCHSPDAQRWFRLQIGGYTEDGRRTAVLAHENITTLKLAERRLADRNALVQAELDRARADLVKHTRLVTIGQVAASIAHELRNPLGAIRNAAYLLKKKLPAGLEDPRRYVGIIESEVASSDRIIGDLMEMARGRSPECARVSAGQLVRDAVARIPDAPIGAVESAYEPGEYAELFIDEGQFAQVLINLISNGLQACERAGRDKRVHVGVAATPQAAEIVVCDAGDGIDPAHRERIFEPMFSTRAKGTGLGLAICKQTVERHGGTITLTDTPSPLGGCCFVVRIPGPSANSPNAPLPQETQT
ncbi:MAG: HAMP domain-containing sensor histidine kinase [Planctomycetota bacterium]